MKNILIRTLMFAAIASFLTGCGGSSKYKKEQDKVYFIHYGGPLPMFGLNWQRHKNELVGADAKTFVDFKHNTFAKDKNHVYYQGAICKRHNFDAPSFVIDQDYAKDKNHVYSLANITIVDSTDVETFVSLGRGWGRDAYNLFHGDKIDFKPRDLASYEIVMDWRFGRDKYHYYFCQKILDVDYASFEFLENGYAKDKCKVYYYHGYSELKVIEGADAESFSVLTKKRLAAGVAKDKDNYYLGMEKATKKEVDDAP